MGGVSDFLLELRSPRKFPRGCRPRRAPISRGCSRRSWTSSALKAEAIETYATPRRLALIARGLPSETQAVSEEIKGPRTSAPPQALEGFLRKTGLPQEQLQDATASGSRWSRRPGQRDARSARPKRSPAIIPRFPLAEVDALGRGLGIAPTVMRWVRPLQGIVALLGDEIVPVRDRRHRLGRGDGRPSLPPSGRITIGGAHDYAEKLRACHVIVDHEEREALVRDGAAKAATDAGLTLVADCRDDRCRRVSDHRRDAGGRRLELDLLGDI